MGELEEKLNTILGDPAAMGQIMALAQSLGQSAPPPSPANGNEDGGEPGWERAGTVPVSAAPPPALETGGENPLAALSSLDPRLLQMGMRLWQEYQGGDERTTDLLQALRPFLRKERQARLDRAVQLAKLSGASQIVLSEPNEKRRQVGLQLGANAAIDPTRPDAQEAFAQVLGGGANVVIECVGNVPAVKSAFQFAGKGATVLLFSVPKVDATFDLPLFDVYKKELTIKGSFVNPDTLARAVALINSGKVDFGPIITHRFTLDQLPEAIAMQMSDASIKVVVEAQ